MKKRKTGLLGNMLAWFAGCMAAFMLLATPLFYWLTKSFYAEDLIEVIETVRSGKPIPRLDLEEDIIQGVMIQFGIIAVLLCLAVMLTVCLISRRTWRPFYNTLESLENFRLEKGVVPTLPESGIKEFSYLNTALTRFMKSCISSFRMQKEFTENASHELQTPLAVFKSKLELLSQLPEITERQAAIIQDLDMTNNRMSKLNRNLLLLAKMENNQFDGTGIVDVAAVVKSLLPYLESLSEGLTLHTYFMTKTLPVRANRPLMESMISNLVVNSVRHNKAGGEIMISIADNKFSVANTSDDGALDGDRIFSRFYRITQDTEGCGLGLSIVKAVCDYHGWRVSYAYREGRHEFTVMFT